MNSKNIKWQTQTLIFNEDLEDAILQQHHASQFIALAGKHLIAQKDDDSNTNMQYIPDRELLLGNKLPNQCFIALGLTDMILYVLDNDLKANTEIGLDGKTKERVFDDLKKALSDSGLDLTKFNNDLHYELPENKLNNNIPFTVIHKENFRENTIYRHNAEIILNEIAAAFNMAEPVRIWPHHFDSGTLLPMEYNKNGELTKSAGLGWAIPDSMVDEPYYYLSFWMKEADGNPGNLPEPDAGSWMTPGWNGAILRHSEIVDKKTASGQHQLVKSFFSSGIKIIQQYLKT